MKYRWFSTNLSGGDELGDIVEAVQMGNQLQPQVDLRAVENVGKRGKSFTVFQHIFYYKSPYFSKVRYPNILIDFQTIFYFVTEGKEVAVKRPRVFAYGYGLEL